MTSLSITRPTVCVARSRTAYSGSVWTAWTSRSCTTFPRTSPTSRTAGRSSTKSDAKAPFRHLSKMRDEGIIRAWGIGVKASCPLLARSISSVGGFLPIVRHHQLIVRYDVQVAAAGIAGLVAGEECSIQRRIDRETVWVVAVDIAALVIMLQPIS